MRRNPIAWVLLGLLFAFIAQLLTFPFAESLLLAVADNDMALSLTSRALIPMLNTGVAYILLRCWALPPEPRRLTSVLLHPLLLVLTLAVMSRAWIAVGRLLGAMFLPWAERLALRWGTTTGVVPSLSFVMLVAGGLFLGAGFGVGERLAARVLRLAAPRALLPAHAFGAAIMAGCAGLVTTALPGIEALDTNDMSLPLFIGMVTVALGLLAAIPYFLLTWRAWRLA